MPKVVLYAKSRFSVDVGPIRIQSVFVFFCVCVFFFCFFFFFFFFFAAASLHLDAYFSKDVCCTHTLYSLVLFYMDMLGMLITKNKLFSMHFKQTVHLRAIAGNTSNIKIFLFFAYSLFYV